METPLKVFISYSHNQNDRPLLDQFIRQMAPLVHAGKITYWEDSKILPSQNWEAVIKENLGQADIVVLLVSSDYSASEFVNRVEVPMAMEREAAGKCKIVPVLLRACFFELMPYSKYEFLPKTAENQRLLAVDMWRHQDEALDVVVRRLYALVNQLTGADAAIQDIPGSTPAPLFTPLPISGLERSGYEAQITLATQKLQHLQTAQILETNASSKFALEHEIQILKDLIAQLKNSLK
jgi:hypothetical protein